MIALKQAFSLFLGRDYKNRQVSIFLRVVMYAAYRMLISYNKRHVKTTLTASLELKVQYFALSPDFNVRLYCFLVGYFDQVIQEMKNFWLISEIIPK